MTAPAAPPAPADLDLRAAAERLHRSASLLRERVATKIVGLDETIEEVLVAILTESHALLEGVPGLAKTLLVSTVAEALDLTFRRIQFTPDLMPSDVTGSEVLALDADGRRRFRFLAGPVFANVILADEINRTPPKTQAALMEAMEERQVTSLGVRRRLDRPFFVLATQNPIEQQGTYPLPAAQLDRFLVKVRMGYPDFDAEERIVRRTTVPDAEGPSEPVASKADLLEFQAVVARTPVPPALVAYAVDLARASRPKEPTAPQRVKDYVSWGAGPRAAQALVNAARARALLRGRVVPDFDDVRALALPVFRHRLVLSYTADADGLEADDVTRLLLDVVPYAGRPEPEKRSRWRAWVDRWLAPMRSTSGLASEGRQASVRSLPPGRALPAEGGAAANGGPAANGGVEPSRSGGS